MSRTTVVIDRVVLRGVDPSSRKGLVEGLQHELRQVLTAQATRGQNPVPRSQPVMKLGSIPLGPGSSGGRRFGQQVARKIGGSLKP